MRSAKPWLLAAAFILCRLPAQGQAPAVPIKTAAIPTPYPADLQSLYHSAVLSTDVPKVAWFPESLEYEVDWGVVSVGIATLSAHDVVLFNGRLAYRIISTAHTAKLWDAFYKVRDSNEAWIDAYSLDSLGYLKNLREGRFFRDEWVLFYKDISRFLAQEKNRKGDVEYSQGEISVPIHDILSSMYYMRNQDLKVGQEYIVDVNTKQNWPLVIKVHRKERLKVPAGDFDCFKIEPLLREEGIFIQKGKKLVIWLSDDPRHIPVEMQAEVFFGHIKARLSKIE
ncbi:MAG: DUF3108 domain-containing protein [Elusimicrobia bacterium]|nr:DUF3108 domain-containing protein [Elusimicrobiota bacterium]